MTLEMKLCTHYLLLENESSSLYRVYCPGQNCGVGECEYFAIEAFVFQEGRYTLLRRDEVKD